MAETYRMGKDDEWFWSKEPRVFISILDQYKEIERANLKALSIYMGCMLSGKDFSEVEKQDEEVAGIDKPVDEKILRGFY